jgi:hypothetical protein
MAPGIVINLRTSNQLSVARFSARLIVAIADIGISVSEYY